LTEVIYLMDYTSFAET